jgi:hypothetical protein
MTRIIFALALAASAAAFAQGAYTVEEVSEIRDFETAVMDGQTIEAVGNDARFEVLVKWRDPEQRPPGAPYKRVFRHVARCADGTLAITSITAFDDNGKVIKTYVFPPGAAEFAPAKEGSREQRWVKQACD